jgi:OmpA-OmpF porin, OOP family
MRNSKAGLLSFVSGLALSGLLFIPTAKAADMPVEPIVEEAQANWYVSLHGGWKFDEDWDDELDASHGDPLSDDFADLTIHTDDGWRIGGALGYSFNEWFAVEGEVAYMTQDFESVVFDEADPAGEFALLDGDEFDLGGDISILTGMVNAIIGFPIGGTFRPYIGAGIGAAHVDADANISNQPPAFPGPDAFHLDDSDTVFAAQAFAGLDIGITENVAIGGRARWLHLSDFDLTDDEDHDHSIDPDGILSAEVVLTFGW